MAPLTDLLRGKTKFIWSSSCQLASENVKSLLCAAPVLLAPCFDKTFTFTLHADASNVGAGAVGYFSSLMRRELNMPSVSFRRSLILISVITRQLRRKH